jgi:hypothetical protein
MDNIKRFLKNCPNWQLRLIVGAVSVVLFIGTAASSNFVKVPMLQVVASMVMFLGTYFTITAPEWRWLLPELYVFLLPYTQKTTYVQPRTRTQRRQDQRKKNKRK